MTIEKLSFHRPEEDRIDEGRRAMVKGIGALLGLSAAGVLNACGTHPTLGYADQEGDAETLSGDSDYQDGDYEGSKGGGDYDYQNGDYEGCKGGGDYDYEGSKGGGDTDFDLTGQPCAPEGSRSPDGQCLCAPDGVCDSPGNSCQPPCSRDANNDCQPPNTWDCF